MIYFNLITLFITVSIITIGILCFLKNKKSFVNTLYLLAIGSLMFWSGALYLGYYFIDIPHISLIFIRLTFGFGALGSAFICMFSYFYLRKAFMISLPLKILYVLLTLGVVVLSSFTGLVYEREIILYGTEIHDVHGPLHIIFVLYYFVNLLLATVFSFKKMRIMHDIERIKVKLVLWGTISIIVPTLLFHMILPRFGIYIFQEEVIYSNLIFIALVGYSMLRYRFLDVKFTITRVVRQGVALLFTALFVSGIRGLIFMSPFLSPYQSQIAPVLYIVAIFMYFYILRGLVADLFYRLFGMTSIEYFSESLHDFTQQPVLYATVDEFREALDELFESVQMDCVDLIPFDKKNQKKYARFVKYFEQHPEILVQNEQAFLPQTKNSSPHFASLGGVYIPLFRSQKVLLGMLVLGEKPFNDLYSVEEIHLLEEFKHFLELRMVGILYSDSLKKEVNKKTKELKQKNKELAQSNSKLQVLDEAKDTFLSIASHELRTPMTVIRGFTDLLLSDKSGKLTKKQKEFLDAIAQNSEDLTVLVNKMLDISALEAGKMEFEWNDIEFPLCLEKIVQEFEILAKEKQIQIEFQNPENVQISIRSDLLKIKQIMGNLLGNALKFTPPKGKITILLEKGTVLESVKISVIDTGIGIPKNEQVMIFQKFHRTNHSNKTVRSGTGLGLHIVQLLVEKLGGEISVTSSKNKGSCFTFSLSGRKK